MARGISLHVGLNKVDPVHYQGWDGELTACEADAMDMASIARSEGFETRTLLTARATRRAVESSLELASSLLDEGDIFLLSYSGHGGQLPDQNGDEQDYFDETWCLYDAEWVDDETYMALSDFKPGVRILVISDSCHSGTVYRNRLLTQRLRSRDGPRYRAMPNDVATLTYRANKDFYDRLASRNALRTARSEVRAAIIALGACQDSELAADGNRNGYFTGALRDYGDFYHDIKEVMGFGDQTPSFVIEGLLSDAFENQRPFTINGG
jgi:hypothetical protein